MQYKWVALTVTTVGALMAALDSSCMTIGLPTVLEDLNANIFHGIWIITGYRLMLTILLVMLGRIADMYGRVKLYNIGFAVFTIGSLFCAISGTGEQLILSRFLQGSGAALLMANSAAIVTDAFPSNELGMGAWDKHDGQQLGFDGWLHGQWHNDIILWLEVHVSHQPANWNIRNILGL